jgi:nicotinate phosphoribosyltransferase
MVVAAGDRPLIEMGSRRTHEQAAIACARAAYIAGFASTSNLAAGSVYGIPTVGTAAHAFTLSHSTERDAFASQVAALGPQTTLLVDTFDTAQGIRTAVEVAGPRLGAIRLDSGDLDIEAANARTLLDSLGATATRITVTSDLDEYVIAALAQAPIDGFGVGTRLVTGSGHPTASLVYKLVAVADSADPAAPLRSVAKTAPGKVSLGGRKAAFRTLDVDGLTTGERIVLDGDVAPVAARLLTHEVMCDGEISGLPTLDASREFHRSARAELGAEHLSIADGEAAFAAVREGSVHEGSTR